MGGKKLNFTIAADNNPAIQAVSELTVAMSKLNGAFKTINQAQKAAKKTNSGAGGILDEKELNAVGDHLKNVNDIIKIIGVTQSRWQRDSGFKGLKKGFDDVKESARGLFSVMQALLAPIMTLTGAGIIGGLASAANAFGNQANRINQVKTETGMKPQEVKGWMNAGAEFGVPKDEMMSGIQGEAQNLRNIALSGNNALLGFLENSLHIKGLRERLYAPNGVQDVMKELPDKVRAAQKENPLMGTKLIEDLQLGFMKPILSAPEDVYQEKMARSKDLFNMPEAEWNKSLRQDYRKQDAEAKIGSTFDRWGKGLQPYWTNFVGGFADFISGDSKPNDWMGPLGKDSSLDKWMKGLFHHSDDINKPANLSESIKKWGSFGDDSDQASNDSSDGISVSGDAPKEQTVRLVVDFNNAPKGTTVSPSSDSVVRVQTNVRYAGFDIQ